MFLYDFPFDEIYSKDNIKISDWRRECPFKCLDKNGKEVPVSTADVGIEYSLDNGSTWTKTNLAIELKKENDFASTLFSDWKRFEKEIARAKEYGLDFYIVYNQTFAKMKSVFAELKKVGKIHKNMIPEKIIMKRIVDLNDKGVKLIFSDDLPKMIKIIIQEHIKKTLRNGGEK